MYHQTKLWVLVIYLPLCSAFVCLRCDNVHRATDCHKVVNCRPGESCFVDEDAQGQGFNLGCRSELTCRNSTNPRCTQCCKTDTCNSKLCGLTGFTASTGPLCYSCNSLLEFEACKSIQQCQKNELCYAESSQSSALGLSVHTHGCKPSQACPAQGTTISPDCKACCQGDLCNANCTQAASVVHFDCDEASNNSSGVYTIYPFKVATKPVQVYCQHEPGGQAWTVIQRRFQGNFSFDRTWKEYKNGFGSPNGQYWLGNDVIHALTANQNYEILIKMSDFQDTKRFAKYDKFWIEDETNLYRLHVSGFTGDTGDDFTYNSLAFFSTRDADHDTAGNSCAHTFHGAWWYKICSRSGLNEQPARWFSFHDTVPPKPLKTTIMMIRKGQVVSTVIG